MCSLSYPSSCWYLICNNKSPACTLTWKYYITLLLNIPVCEQPDLLEDEFQPTLDVVSHCPSSPSFTETPRSQHFLWLQDTQRQVSSWHWRPVLLCRGRWHFVAHSWEPGWCLCAHPCKQGCFPHPIPKTTRGGGGASACTGHCLPFPRPAPACHPAVTCPWGKYHLG